MKIVFFPDSKVFEFYLLSSCRSDPSEAVLQAMQRSRCLLFVLSPAFLTEKGFSLLECRVGLYLQHGHQASIAAVVYHSVSKLHCVEVTQLCQAAVSTVKWRGSRSEPRRSRFWLRLRLALPLRPLAMGRRLIDSTSSHSDLAAVVLHRAQWIQHQSQNQRDRTNQSHKNRRASLSQGHMGRQAPPTARGSVKRGVTSRDEGSHHSRGCSRSTGFIHQVDDREAELTEMQHVSHDRTEEESAVVPETDPVPEIDVVPETDPTPIPDTVPDSTSPTREQDEDVLKVAPEET
uniref:uncharacterized protein LOC122773549 n=1 Tax=Solea senegalensis TaxID=28829 RepID=UPI001CD820F8|nr:uncharacterized protein LOC122773549 [Solea senegalensis]